MDSIPQLQKNRLTEMAAKAAEPLGLVILRLTARGVPSRPIVEVILDGPKLVSIEDCQIVNKALNEAIENDESLLKGNYRLDVLSPGLDEPVVHDYQFQRTIGHLVEVSYNDGENKTSVIGKLKSFAPDEIIINKRQSKKGSEPLEIVITRQQIISIFARPDFG
jgi:ribosome maturation factor RimP